MAHNLRPRQQREQLLLDGDSSSSDDGQWSIQSDSDTEEDVSDSDNSENNFSDHDMDDEVETAVCTERASRYRGRNNPKVSAQNAARSREAAMDIDNVPLSQRLLSANENSSGTKTRGRPKTTLLGKNGFSWSTRYVARRSDRTRAVYSKNAEIIGGAENYDSIEDFWDLLFSKEMIDLIVEYTNNKIEQNTVDILAEDAAASYHHQTDDVEIKAFIGILLYSGLWKSNHVDVNELWNKTNGMHFYRCVLSRNRFIFLQSCLRFDNKEERDVNDRFSAIREIWTIFIDNCGKYYKPSSKCTVDEQLLCFRGRCIFRMYMKSKPDKYGLKLLTLNDATTAYLIFAIPYLGKTAPIENLNKLPVSEYFFEKVTEPIHGTFRTVTCDNWFTSVPLLQRMKQEPFNMSITGTIRKNKKEIPLEMKIANSEPPGTKFCFSPDITLVSYTPRKNKIVLVASTFMHTTAITNDKANIILHYNETKGGTDTFDQLCHAYTVTRRTNKWPMRIFYGIVDQAMVNSRILWKLKLGDGCDRNSTTAIIAMKKVITHLITPLLRRKLQNEVLPKELKVNIKSLLGQEDSTFDAETLQKVEFEKKTTMCDVSQKDR